MFCVKVQPGRERIHVRKYTNGFLPSYFSAEDTFDESAKNGIKRLVVPGYVFMLQTALGAIMVPAEEWKVIEAVSDSHASVLDPETGKITEGPLKEIEGFIVRTEKDRVLIRTQILGETRSYWIRVKTAEDEAEEQKPDEADAGKQEQGDAPAAQPEGSKPADGKGKRAFTEEQKAEMLAEAEEIGVRATAEAYGVPWQTIAQIKRRAAENKGGTAEKKSRRKAEEHEAAGTTGGEPISPAEENAFLREKVAKLETQVEKLKKAIRELM